MSYNLARFDLVSIRLAVACAQTGSLTAAARDSHLALAAASRRELEAPAMETANPACTDATRRASGSGRSRWTCLATNALAMCWSRRTRPRRW